VQRAAVIGYSAGASVALDLALHKPEIVSSLVLLDPAVNIKRCLTLGFVKTLLLTRVLRRLKGERAGAEYWIRYVASYTTGGTAFDKASPQRREATLTNARGMFADAQTATKHSIDEDRMGSLPMPVAIIDAKLSPSFLRKSSERLRRAVPQARCVTLGSSGHHVMIDARDEVLANLRDVVGATTAAPAT
jgi:pimeloyl-ACP methyl ester carboxylesterase